VKSIWNVESLKLFFDAEIKAVRDSIQDAKISNKEAVEKLEATTADKNETQNEWRAQLKDQVGLFVTRKELWGAILGILAILISLFAIILTRK
jgi:hypothetical protein